MKTPPSADQETSGLVVPGGALPGCVLGGAVVHPQHHGAHHGEAAQGVEEAASAEAAGGDEHSDDEEHGHAHEPNQPAVTVPGAGRRGLGCGCLGRLRELCVVVGR